ncbi:hypothetical protein NAD41_002365 [Salmonella enterica]|nr:hypothetical protein [Salmonella enterica]EKK6596333.1 hypothetical protein [Salmonella enterica]
MDAKKYKLIYADPPWEYKDKAKDGKRGAGFKYPTMTIQEICRLAVWELADPESCLLAMWWVPTMPAEALKVVEAWGFRFMTMKGFTWHKTNKVKGNTAMGMGHLTRANSEDCLFAVRGRVPPRIDAGVIQHITAARGEHSAKPDEVRHRLERLLGDVPRIELFARGKVEGWDTWGNQAEKNAIEFVPARAVVPFNWKDPDSPFHPANALKNIINAPLPAVNPVTTVTTLPHTGLSPAFALLEQKAMEDFCDSPVITGIPRKCPRCGELTRLEYHTCRKTQPDEPAQDAP